MTRVQFDVRVVFRCGSRTGAPCCIQRAISLLACSQMRAAAQETPGNFFRKMFSEAVRCNVRRFVTPSVKISISSIATFSQGCRYRQNRHCASCFELYTHDVHGYKYYADREEDPVAPLTLRQEQTMSQTEIHAHLNSMDNYYKKTQKKDFLGSHQERK